MTDKDVAATGKRNPLYCKNRHGMMRSGEEEMKWLEPKQQQMSLCGDLTVQVLQQVLHSHARLKGH